MGSIDYRKIKFDYSTDKNPLAYKVNEPMVFTFTLNYNQNISKDVPFYIRWSRAGDDGIADAGISRITQWEPVSVTTSLSIPGFVHIIAEIIDASGELVTCKPGDTSGHPLCFDGGAGADVDKILPAAEEPDDFDEYWHKQRAILDTVPIQASSEELSGEHYPEEFHDKVEISAVSITCFGPKPVTGYLFRPRNARPGSLPVRIQFHGYNCSEDYSDVHFDYATVKAGEKSVVFNVNAHGYELGREKDYYIEETKRLTGYGLDPKENDNPDTAYFRFMAFRVMRAFDYAKTLPEWNGKDLIAEGGSQGGLQTMWAASLVPELSVCEPYITWCSDMNGSAAGRLTGWCPEYRKGMGYFDTVFHSRRIPLTCKMIATRYGLGDYCCPPSGVAAHFNAANCEKKAMWMQNSQHCTCPLEPDQQKFYVEKPAGMAIFGVAPKAKATQMPAVSFVQATINADKWSLFRADGSTVKDFFFAGKQTNFKKGLAKDGTDLPIESTVLLKGELIAEQDGFVLLGAGFDWWWTVKVNQTIVFGRTQSSGSNDVSTFEKTDWIFRAPVKKGLNELEIEIVLGQYGTGNFDILPDEFASQEISFERYQQFKQILQNYPLPVISPEFEQNGNAFTFTTKQAFPAGIEFWEKGKESHMTIGDGTLGTAHTIVLPIKTGIEYEGRIIQNVYQCSWKTIKGEVFAIQFKTNKN